MLLTQKRERMQVRCSLCGQLTKKNKRERERITATQLTYFLSNVWIVTFAEEYYIFSFAVGKKNF